MKRTKEHKGITLIALIITIVVLLILAVVAIGQAQETNIVGYAQNAASEYEEGKGIENNTISDMETLLEKYANTNKEPGLIGIKVYSIDGGGGAYILTPENELVFFRDGSPVEQGRVILSEGTGGWNTLHEGFDDKEKENLKYLFCEDEVVAISLDGNTLYLTTASDEETNTKTFSKDSSYTHYEELVAKYTYDSEKYEVYSGEKQGMKMFIYIDHESNTISSYYTINNGGWNRNSKGSITSIENNPEEINFVLDGQPYKIGKDAVKITCNNDVGYIKDNTFYGFNVREGDTITKGFNAFDLVEFFDISALPDNS